MIINTIREYYNIKLTDIPHVLDIIFPNNEYLNLKSEEYRKFNAFFKYCWKYSINTIIEKQKNVKFQYANQGSLLLERVSVDKDDLLNTWKNGMLKHADFILHKNYFFLQLKLINEKYCKVSNVFSFRIMRLLTEVINNGKAKYISENIDGKDFKQDYLNENKIDSDTFDRYYQIFVRFMYYVVSKKIFLMIKTDSFGTCEYLNINPKGTKRKDRINSCKLKTRIWHKNDDLDKKFIYFIVGHDEFQKSFKNGKLTKLLSEKYMAFDCFELAFERSRNHHIFAYRGELNGYQEYMPSKYIDINKCDYVYYKYDNCCFLPSQIEINL